MKTIKAKLLALRALAVLVIIVLSAAGFYGLSESKIRLDELNANRLPSQEPAATLKEYRFDRIVALCDAK